jgi:hypothetical protein
MKHKPRLLLYILLNILISAVTTLTVLWLWERAHPRPIVDLESLNLPTPNPTLTENIENSSIEFVEGDFEVEIYAVVGAGNLDVEYVEIRNLSPGPVDPAGWQLIDEDGHSFTFPTSPSWVLNSNGAVKILSKKGNHSVIELYWQADDAIWQSGELATLLDANGETIATYSIP